MPDLDRFRSRLKRVRHAVDELLFPVDCQLCGSDAHGLISCPTCRDQLLGEPVARCRRCALPIGPYADERGPCDSCRGTHLGFQEAVTLGAYEGDLRHLVLRLKHRGQSWLADGLSGLLVEVRGERLPRENALIVAVPLHWTRRLERGYNQAQALAEGLGRRLRLPVRHALRRVQAGSMQGLGRAERIQRMRRAFRPRPRACSAGTTILLVDDVMTTGATLGAAARALRAAGTGEVIAVVLARAEHP